MSKKANQQKVVMPGLDPGLHAVATIAGVCCEHVDAHGTCLWAEGAWIKSGHNGWGEASGPG
jgi:hypothetical protein